MKIAVTSQNFRTITGHAGKTRRFLIYETDTSGKAHEAERLNLPKELSMHAFHNHDLHPLDAMDVVITASCGEGFRQRMARRGIRVVVTGEPDPLTAVSALVAGRPLPPATDHQHQVTGP